MNYQRKKFEERLEKANLSDGRKEYYRQLNLQILRLRLMNGITKVSAWAEKIKPLVVVSAKDEKVVFNDLADETRKRVVSNVSAEANILVSLASGEGILERLKCKLNRLCVFTAYLPNSEGNPLVPEISALNVLGQLPENIPVGQAEYFEVRFASDNFEDDYDEILQAHKVKIILYAPAYDLLKRARNMVRERLSESKNEKTDKQATAAESKKTGEKSEGKKNPCKDVPLRQC